MTLKQMHVFFITLSIGLTVVVAAWAVRAYMEPTGTAWHLGWTTLSLLAGAALWTYEAAFLRKARWIGLP